MGWIERLVARSQGPACRLEEPGLVRGERESAPCRERGADASAHGVPSVAEINNLGDSNVAAVLDESLADNGLDVPLSLEERVRSLSGQFDNGVVAVTVHDKNDMAAATVQGLQRLPGGDSSRKEDLRLSWLSPGGLESQGVSQGLVQGPWLRYGDLRRRNHIVGGVEAKQRSQKGLLRLSQIENQTLATVGSEKGGRCGRQRPFHLLQEGSPDGIRTGEIIR